MITTRGINNWLIDKGYPANDGYLLKDSGEGNYIAEWNLDIPQPDISEIEEYEKEAYLSEIKNNKITEINAACDAATAEISSKYPRSEMDTWPQQVKEAEAYKAETNASVPMLKTIAKARGITVKDQADRVLTKFQQYADAVGKAVGKRQKLEADIQAATTVEEVQAISW